MSWDDVLVELLCLFSLDTQSDMPLNLPSHEAYTGAAKTLAAKAKMVIE
jgi:hypothetical protein